MAETSGKRIRGGSPRKKKEGEERMKINEGVDNKQEKGRGEKDLSFDLRQAEKGDVVYQSFGRNKSNLRRGARGEFAVGSIL